MTNTSNSPDRILLRHARYADLPPIPPPEAVGRDVCVAVRLYLGVMDDLSPQQIASLTQHIARCAACNAEFQSMQQATRLVGSLPAIAPSERVDAAILSLMRNSADQADQADPRSTLAAHRVTPGRRARPHRQRRGRRIFGELAAVAVIMLALLASLYFLGIPGVGSPDNPRAAFALPANLSWSQYVLYHTETRVDASGELYQVASYHDLGTGMLHVETTMSGQVDIVAVGSAGNAAQMVGLDMVHHVAQMGASQWSVDDSVFDLNALRHDLQDKQAVYLDTETFKGQQVYRIRYSNGLVILLNMRYLPVNVLRGSTGAGTGYSIYTTLTLLLASQVSSSMWDMSIPQGFKMGTMPPPMS